MKKLIAKALIFSALIGCTIFGVIYLPPIDPDRYIMALLDKHRLLETTPQPRIIVAGDSNLAFGLDSGMIKKATGYNIINMGLHGGLGLIYSMDELKPYLKKGDIVIFIPDNPYAMDLLLLFAREYHALHQQHTADVSAAPARTADALKGDAHAPAFRIQRVW